MQYLHRSMWKGNDPTRPKGLIHTYLRPTLPLKRFEYLLSSACMSFRGGFSSVTSKACFDFLPFRARKTEH